MSAGDRDYQAVPVKGLEGCGSIHPPSKDCIRLRRGSRRNECGDRAEQSGDLEVTALKFLPQANGSVRTGSIGLRGEGWRCEKHVGTWLFQREVQGCSRPQREAISKLRIAQAH